MKKKCPECGRQVEARLSLVEQEVAFRKMQQEAQENGTLIYADGDSLFVHDTFLVLRGTEHTRQCSQFLEVTGSKYGFTVESAWYSPESSIKR
jgi:hypothetical protein